MNSSSDLTVCFSGSSGVRDPDGRPSETGWGSGRGPEETAEGWARTTGFVHRANQTAEQQTVPAEDTGDGSVEFSVARRGCVVIEQATVHSTRGKILAAGNKAK